MQFEKARKVPKVLILQVGNFITAVLISFSYLDNAKNEFITAIMRLPTCKRLLRQYAFELFASVKRLHKSDFSIRRCFNLSDPFRNVSSPQSGPLFDSRDSL